MKEPVLKIGIVFTNGRDCDDPPKNQPIDYDWVPMGYPKAKLQKEGVKLDCHKNDAENQDLDEPPGTKKRVPLVFVPMSWGELP